VLAAVFTVAKLSTGVNENGEGALLLLAFDIIAPIADVLAVVITAAELAAGARENWKGFEVLISDDEAAEGLATAKLLET
jgi:hypothetical protein